MAQAGLWERKALVLVAVAERNFVNQKKRLVFERLMELMVVLRASDLWAALIRALMRLVVCAALVLLAEVVVSGLMRR